MIKAMYEDSSTKWKMGMEMKGLREYVGNSRPVSSRSVRIYNMQYGYMAERNRTDAIFIVHQ